MRTGLLLTALALGLSVTALPASAETLHLFGPFKGEHGATTPIKGSASAMLDTTKNTLTYRFEDNGLSGPVTAIHLHGPADAGEDAGVLAPINGPYTTRMTGTLQLTPDQVKDVQAGRSYINLHTEKFPDGEARAQLTTELTGHRHHAE
ncbi:CHRD domain-containing protein [Gluconobacter kondonii]|mgnify:FL=1|uniref:CHRD domain-containing protein n=1 Tax=Gluconobacter kondonii TaxID=941463 RepID=UPI00197EAF55|nr:CHRD domain-containing protein [Gluconobacter kondonii]MBN3866260.1 CHRD domain-containing protein [Gluconobacter kondonii]MBS1052051.1 CHRD domain-containing protein [Gluconobacter kondonii]MBS1055305.1 CHRD domain-containing protein [Gluconobacter kondonii]MBS1064440.1 CHRD domain-containing protein [Gluconobacter kondonii]MBS1076914.1 CHRD domain-containing protein [Gluconobacter kondonii]